MKTILITGANGFLGSACCAAFSRAGYNVRALVRNPQSPEMPKLDAEGGIYQSELAGHIDKSAFERPIHAVVHCAYVTSAARTSDVNAVNVEGARRLRELSRENGAERFVFVSSLAAHAEAVSTYGTSKWLIEQTFTSSSDSIVKPGVIIGLGGVFARTRDMISKLPIVPVVYPRRELQIIWIEDAAQGIVETVRRAISGTVILAAPKPVRVRDFYDQIARLNGRRKTLVPIPGDAALAALRVLEGMGLRLPISSDNLLGVRHLRFFDPQGDLERLGLVPLNFEESLGRLKVHLAG